MSKKQFTSDTIGLITDLSTKEGVILIDETAKVIGDHKFCKVVENAKDSGIPFFIAAGRFGEKGFVAISCHEEQDLLFEFCQVNEWLNDIRAKTTAWIIMPSLHKLLNKGGGI